MINRIFRHTPIFVVMMTIAAFGPLIMIMQQPQTVRGYDGEAYAIRGGTVVTVTGQTIEKGTVVIRGGLITAVGANIEIPSDARIIEAAGLTVYPGLFNSWTTYGKPPEPTPTPGSSDPSQAFLTRFLAPQSNAGLLPETTIVDQLLVTDATFETQRAAGITSALTALQTGVYQGQSAVINLGTDSAEKLILKTPYSLNVGFSGARGGYPGSLMGVFSFLRQSLLDAQNYRDSWAIYHKSPRGSERPNVNKSLKALQPVIAGEMPVIFAVNSVREMKRAIALAEEFKLKYLLAGGIESFKVADYLKSKNATVLLSVSYPQKPQVVEDPESETLETLKLRANAPTSAAALSKAGVKFAFHSGNLSKPQDYIANISRAIDAGLSKEEALKALTIYPAQIFGLSEQLGSLEAGKIANIVIADGDIFKKETKVKKVFVDGKVFDIKVPEPPAKKPALAESKMEQTPPKQ